MQALTTHTQLLDLFTQSSKALPLQEPATAVALLSRLPSYCPLTRGDTLLSRHTTTFSLTYNQVS